MNMKVVNNSRVSMIAIVTGITVLMAIVSVTCLFIVVSTMNPTDESDNIISRPVENPSEEYEIYSNPDIPGFSIRYPSEWGLLVKDFYAIDTIGFENYYFTECSEDCMGIRLVKNNIGLDIVFNAVLDGSNHVQCTNTIETETVLNGWYRINDPIKQFYTSNIKFDINEAPDILTEYTSSDGNWSNNTAPYKYCIYGYGQFLGQTSSIKVIEGNEALILMENPIIKGNPSAEDLMEIDEIVNSIDLGY